MLFKKASKELLKGSLALLVFINIFNLLNLIFNFVSARLLGPLEYGILATIMSLTFIFSIPHEAIQLIVSRYAVKFYAKEDYEGIKNLLVKSLKKFGLASLACFFAFLALSPLLSRLLSIEKNILFLTSFFLFGAFLAPITKGILQGTKKFNSLGVTYVAEGGVKLLLAVLFILLGWGVYGAIGGVISGLFLSFFVSLILLKKFIVKKRKSAKIEGIYSYSFPALLSIAMVMVFLSLDIILAKMFFPPEIVGKYAAISNLGKVIFLGTWGISKAMFPMAAEHYDQKKNPKKILEQSLLTIFSISSAVFLLYYLFSKPIIFFLYGQQYQDIAFLLVYPSIAMILLSITNVFIMYNLSINKGGRNYISVLFVLLEVLLLYLFHSTLVQFSIMFITTSALFCFAMLLSVLKDRSNIDYI